MHEVTFTLETVTPLFLAGANQEEAELRAPSFRGVLRYWLRALLGGLYGTDRDGLKKVWEEEQSVFGTTDHGSAVTIRLSQGDLLSSQEFKKQPPVPGPHGKPQPTGRDYLLWSMAGMRREDPGRWYFPPGRTFTLTLSMRGAPSAAELPLPLQKAVTSFWLMTQLGGIGARSRRGAGSLAVTHTDNWRYKPAFSSSPTPELLRQSLRDGLRDALQLFASDTSHMTHQQPSFDALVPLQDFCRIWVIYDERPWNTGEEALKAIGERMRDFRSHRGPDHQEVPRWLSGNDIQTVQRAIFGLPIQFRYSNGGPSDVVQGIKPGAGREPPHIYDRRASPLLFRVARLDGAKPGFVGIAVLFKSQFLPEHVQLAAKNHHAAPKLAQPGYRLIEDWITTFPQCLEVW